MSQSTGFGNVRITSLAATLVLIIWGAALLATPPALAQDDKLPAAEKILDQYIEATGGKDNYDKIKNRVIQGTFEVPAQQVKGSVAIYAARPNLLYSAVEMPGMKQEQGTDGKVAWERQTLTGARVLEGTEREQFLADALFDGEIQWRRLFKEVKTAGVEDVADQPAYKVELLDKEGNRTTQYYDQKSHLLVKIVTTRKTPMGDVTADDFVSDYRKVGDVLLPHRHRNVVLGTEQVITFNSIKVNADLDKDRFEVPEDVRALIGQDKEQKQTP